MITYFDSEESMGLAFDVIREKYFHSHPHSKLMQSVSQFKVAFSKIISS